MALARSSFKHAPRSDPAYADQLRLSGVKLVVDVTSYLPAASPRG